MSQSNSRVAEFPVDPQFLNRWSPRAYTGADISEETVLSFIEAARWAPSSYNAQPWRLCLHDAVHRIGMPCLVC